MPTDVKQALTRKLGPFPAWGWGVGIGGAVIVYRIIRPKAPTSSLPSTSGGSPVGTDQTGSGTAADPTLITNLQDQIKALQDSITQQGQASSAQETQLTSLQTQLQQALDTITQDQSTIGGLSGQVAGLSGTIGNLSAFQALQQKLDSLLSQRQSALYQISHYQIAAQTTTDPTKKAAYLAQVAKYTKIAAGLQTQITATQTQMNQIGASS